MQCLLSTESTEHKVSSVLTSAQTALLVYGPTRLRCVTLPVRAPPPWTWPHSSEGWEMGGNGEVSGASVTMVRKEIRKIKWKLLYFRCKAASKVSTPSWRQAFCCESKCVGIRMKLFQTDKLVYVIQSIKITLETTFRVQNFYILNFNIYEHKGKVCIYSLLISQHLTEDIQ